MLESKRPMSPSLALALVTLPFPSYFQIPLFSFFLPSAANQGCLRPHFWGLTTAQKHSGPLCVDCLAPAQALPLPLGQLDSYASVKAQVTGPSSSAALGPQNSLSLMYLWLFGNCMCFFVYPQSLLPPSQ